MAPVQVTMPSSVGAHRTPWMVLPSGEIFMINYVTRCIHSHTTSENMATWRRRQDLTSLSCTSNTSHCFALKNVEGPTGGPNSGDTTILRLPPTCIPLMPSSKPARTYTWLAVHDLTASPTLIEVGLNGHPDCPTGQHQCMCGTLSPSSGCSLRAFMQAIARPHRPVRF